ncbi:MAG TPA: hypothetical protein ENG95_02560 [Nitrospirae bacterium]|nr:nucleotidyltransferase domain protein [bacterium BMS3Abin10]GBE39627.1 nucleotidyltransferase domain protein [bacterium BMS3Bbin08]HDH00519.1 hypothetical protein [Nitrospirota bacterium]HDK81840.1 hypothetical protein [Nitrospirota bacterium]HDO25513.1 hypothetical protein [Nitrospirota bacterium]
MNIANILFRSKIRQKILAKFFADESKKYYINEMARLVGTTQGTCRRELNRLIDMGILTTSREGNLRYYKVNKEYGLYKEFSAIIQKTIGIEAVLARALNGIKDIIYAFIFGSYAKNEFKPGSDIDIVVIGNVSENHLIKAIREVEKVIEREINYHIYSLKEFKRKLQTSSFAKNIIKNLIIVKGDKNELTKLLKRA